MPKRSRPQGAPDSALVALAVARAYEKKGQLEQARHQYQLAASEADTSQQYTKEVPLGDEPPRALVASVSLTRLARLTTDIDAADLGTAANAARELFERALRLWPNNAQALCDLADLEHRLGRISSALPHYYACAALEGPLTLSPTAVANNTHLWYTELLIEPRLEAVSVASYMAALLLHQLERCDQATPLLRRLGVCHRLSRSLWSAIATPPPAEQQQHSDNMVTHPVARYSDVVPAPLLARLSRAFSASSPFWAETDYASRGYYSFWYDALQPPSHAVEELARLILPLTGCVDKVVGCEWWAHSKAARRGIGGHQLHFDTEEVTLARGEMVHPAVSTVIYLTGDVDDDADPTVIFDQVWGEGPAPHAYVSHPVKGDVLLFFGDRLHCVAPRAAPAMSPSADRVTLMIGFWTIDVASAAPRKPLSACGPMPAASTSCAWPTWLARAEGNGCSQLKAKKKKAVPTQPRRQGVPRISPAWEEVTQPVQSKKKSKRREADLGVKSDIWCGLVDIPASRNSLFFLHDMRELLFLEEDSGNESESGG